MKCYIVKDSFEKEITGRDGKPLKLSAKEAMRVLDFHHSTKKNINNLLKQRDSAKTNKAVLVDDTHYEVNGKKYQRQSDFTNPKTKGELNVGTENRMRKGSAIGNVVDHIGRMILAESSPYTFKMFQEQRSSITKSFEASSISEDGKSYINGDEIKVEVNEEMFNTIVDGVNDMKAKLSKGGYTEFLTEEVPVFGNFKEKQGEYDGVAGTTDVLACNPETGEIVIIDFKTITDDYIPGGKFKDLEDKLTDNYGTGNKWAKQQGSYAALYGANAVVIKGARALAFQHSGLSDNTYKKDLRSELVGLTSKGSKHASSYKEGFDNLNSELVSPEDTAIKVNKIVDQKKAEIEENAKEMLAELTLLSELLHNPSITEDEVTTAHLKVFAIRQNLNSVGNASNIEAIKSMLAVADTKAEELGNLFKQGGQPQPSEVKEGVTIADYGDIAADYLFTGGKGVILSTDYFLQALTACFPYAGETINNIRNKYASELGNLNKDIGSETYNKVVKEIQAEIQKVYNSETANKLLQKLLDNSTGFISRVGNQVSIELDKLNAEFAALEQPQPEGIDDGDIGEGIDEELAKTIKEENTMIDDNIANKLNSVSKASDSEDLEVIKSELERMVDFYNNNGFETFHTLIIEHLRVGVNKVLDAIGDRVLQITELDRLANDKLMQEELALQQQGSGAPAILSPSLSAALMSISSATEETFDGLTVEDKVTIGAYFGDRMEGMIPFNSLVKELYDDGVITITDMLGLEPDAISKHVNTRDITDAIKAILDQTKPKKAYINKRQVSTPANVTQEVEWMFKVLPDVGIDVVSRLISTPLGMAEGVYHRGAITLYEGMSEGTVYHEAFHAVMDMAFTREQREALYREVGWAGEETDYDNDPEELLAEEFRDFMLNKNSYVSKYGVMGKMFNILRDIINAILSPVIGDKYTIFAKIAKGRYSNIKTSAYSGMVRNSMALSSYKEVSALKAKALSKGLLTIKQDKDNNCKHL